MGSSNEEVLCMVKAGVGLMVSFKGRGVIRIYNQETFNHLQDVNIASSVTQILEGMLLCLKGLLSSLKVCFLPRRSAFFLDKIFTHTRVRVKSKPI